MATNTNRWQSPSNAAALSSGSASGSSSNVKRCNNNHLRDDTQMIDLTPLSTNSAQLVHPSPIKACCCLHLNRTPLDHSRRNSRLYCNLSQSQQQRLIRMASSASSAPSPLNPTGVPPSSLANNLFSWSYPASSSSNAPNSLPDLRLGVLPVHPATLHPRAYAAHSSGRLAKSKSGSNFEDTPWKSATAIHFLGQRLGAGGVAVYLFFFIPYIGMRNGTMRFSFLSC